MPYELRTSSANVSRTWKWIFATVPPGVFVAGCVISIMNSYSIAPASTMFGGVAYHTSYGLVFTLFISMWLGMVFGFSKWLKSINRGLAVATAIWILSCILLFQMDIIKFRKGTETSAPIRAQFTKERSSPAWFETKQDDYGSLTKEQEQRLRDEYRKWKEDGSLTKEQEQRLRDEYRKWKEEWR
ncbi:MAG TPA: hypothetical protein ACFYEA_11370 [Candidatus Tripitaka californicus]|uniref:hypothetical protein n=1 Tax=Candidatus Tripitaka californicus TaxID=3367616 RepID=UPI0040264F6B